MLTWTLLKETKTVFESLTDFILNQSYFIKIRVYKKKAGILVGTLINFYEF